MPSRLDFMRRREEEVEGRFRAAEDHGERARAVVRVLEKDLASARARVDRTRDEGCPAPARDVLPGLLFASGLPGLPRDAAGSFLDTLMHGVVILNARGSVLFGNSAWYRSVLGGERARRDGDDYFDLVARRAGVGDATALPGDLASGLRSLLAGRVGAHHCELMLAGPDGPQHFLVDAVPLPRGGALVVHVDATRLIEARNEIAQRAERDGLTDLLNHQAFHARAREALRLAAQDGTRFQVLMIDLDAFKAVNDRHGHHVGDYVLVKVAQRLRTCLFRGDVAGRLGGDEFAALVQRVEDPSALTRRVESKLAAPLRVEGSTLPLPLSVGVAAFPEDGGTVDEILRRADARMYEAKRAKDPEPPPRGA